VKIIVAEKISATAVEHLQEPGWTVLTADQLEGKLVEHLESADALIVRSAVQADAALLEHGKKLRVIGRAGVGVDNIDLEAATHKGIAVMNTPGANAVAFRSRWQKNRASSFSTWTNCMPSRTTLRCTLG
jgi:D-3-phosphoglycerate dehydrogenase